MGRIGDSRYITNAGWDDVPHLTEEMKREIEELTPAHLLPAAKTGLPLSTVGRILPWDFSRIEIPPMKLPPSWPSVYGFDPSVNKTAAMWGRLDEQTDTLYLTGEYLGTTPVPRWHAQAIKLRGDWQTGVCDPSAEGKTIEGKKIVDIYRGLGLNLVYADNAVQAGIDAIIDRVVTGRINAFSNLVGFKFEWNNYRRDDKQQIVKKDDDRMDCVRYICLGGLAHARVNPKYLEIRARGRSRIAPVADTRAGF